MGQKTIKKTKRIAREVAQQYAFDTHLETIRQYIDGIIDLKWHKRLKVCWAIFKKRNPFGKSPVNKEKK